MKAVILAAGVSNRLRPLTDFLPKCLLEVSGTPILKRSLDTLVAAGVREVAIVVGYRELQIREAVNAWAAPARVTFVSNPDYATTNNCVSLMISEGFVAESEFLLVDGDLVFERAVVDAVLASTHANCFVLRPADDLGPEEMKAELTPDLRLLELSKDLELERAAGESVGMFRFSDARFLFGHVRSRVVTRGLTDEWYESSFQQAIDDGLQVYAVPVRDGYVSEIDTPEDLARVDSELRGLSASGSRGAPVEVASGRPS